MMERIKKICDYAARGAAPNYVDDSEYKVVNQATFSKGYLDLSNVRYTTNANPDALIHRGDLLIASTGGGVLGKVLYFEESIDNLYADTHVSILRSKKNNMKYVYYFFSIRYNEINAKLALGSTNQTELQRDLLLAYEIDIPSLPDQNRIVAYLDEKTAAIDKQVSLLELKKEKYAMLKKSVIKQAVCGEGKDWTNHRFKYFASTIKGKSMDYFDDPIDGSKLVLTVETLRMDNPTFSNYGLSYDREQECHEGDIVIIWDGAGVGEFLHAKEGVLSSTVAKIDLNEKKMLKRYFWYWGGQIEYELKSMPTGMGIPHLDPHILNNYKIPLPPLSEQKAIADYLDEKCAKIDATIANIDQQIEKYKLLRRALINEVVTGQRAV